MAQKQSDPVYILAERIVDSAQQIASSHTEKAHYDKTFSAIILGRNQKFTDNVSEDEQSEIIEKFSIPETMEEGKDNYYTFKINGVYYCKSQNGDFKLYDKIMVYIPNGNWSDMYFDYADGASHNSGGGGGSDTELPDYIVSPDMPGGDDCNIGDLWIVTNDETITEFTNLTKDTFVNMYEYKADENEVVDWRLVKVCISETSSKVDVIIDDYWIKTDENNVFTEIDMWETSGSTTSFYEIYPNPEREAAPNVSIYNYTPLKLGDYWYEIDGDASKNLEARWIYSFNPETNRNEYKNEYNIQGGSGGVGEKVPESPNQSAERFNDYRQYTIDGENSTGGNFSTGLNDHVEGYGNHGIGGSNNSYSGSGNYGYNCSGLDIGGYNNKARSCNSTVVQGIGNDVNSATTSAFFGNNLYVSGATNVLALGAGTIAGQIRDSLFIQSTGGQATGNISGAISIGDMNKILGNCGQLAVFGGSNTITNSGNGSFVAGYENTLTGRRGILLGSGGVIDDNNPYVFAVGRSAGSGNGFAMDAYGNVYAAGAYNTMGADYAEYFEWADGNPENEDRRGLLVNVNATDTLDEYDPDCEKIYLADGDDFIGAVSANPSIIGDAHKSHRNRPEWSPIGLIGKLIVVDNGKCKPGNYIQAQNGVAIPCDHSTRAKMMRRVDENHIKILLI